MNTTNGSNRFETTSNLSKNCNSNKFFPCPSNPACRPPFTLQRLCEVLLAHPTREGEKLPGRQMNKFLITVEKVSC